MATPCYERVIYGPNAGGGVPDPVQNAIIPLTGEHKLLSEIVYSEDGRQTAYRKNRLELEAIIQVASYTGTTPDMEKEVERIRTILSTPALQLKVFPVGLGEILAINVGQNDMLGGPLPVKVFVQPMVTNQAILIRWVVDFHTIKCPSPLTVNLVQYVVQQTLNTDDDGNMAFDINITFQTPNPITDPQAHSAITEIMVRRTDKSFQGFRKTITTNLSPDQRTMRLAVRYQETKSDNAFYPFTSDIKVRDNFKSRLFGGDVISGTGFYTWARRIGGTIRIPARIDKAYAWIVFLKILRARFKKLYPFSKLSAIFDVTPPTGQNNPEADRQDQYYLPLEIEIENPLYEREMKFNVTYVVVVDLDNLIAVTKAFSRVNTLFTGTEEQSEPQQLSDQWLAWNNSRGHPINGKFGYTITGTPIVFNQCAGTYSDHQIGADQVKALEDDPDWDNSEGSSLENAGYGGRDAAYPEKIYGDGLTVKNSWVMYKNEFAFDEEVNSMPISFLEQPSQDYYRQKDTDGTYTDREYQGMTLHGRINDSSYPQTYPNETVNRGFAVNNINMSGMAIRVGAKIPIPFVVQVGSKPVSRRRCRVKQTQIAAGDIPVYLAMWDIDYQVVGGDISSGDILTTVKSAGAPATYT